ncbi:MAG: VanW family protein [Clostridia bacterium]|nr:VanW family protein [Clostridia bacterium]
MKKYILWIILAIAIVLGLIYFFNRNGNSETDTNYNSTRTSQNIAGDVNSADNTEYDSNDEENNDENIDETDNSEDASDEKDSEKNSSDENSDNSQEAEDSNKDDTQNNKKSSKETEIASFSTKIYTKDSGRQNNLTIACSTLNDTTVENGKTFSFSKTVGKATSGKGYKKADVFRNGDVIEALGGGLCQVSTTLYNAVLKVPELKVTERHPHSNKVPYIKSGKDAAVSFGAQDFKFVNNTGNTIKIKASNTKNNVTIKILKLE